jgi:hypothetical protein
MEAEQNGPDIQNQAGGPPLVLPSGPRRALENDDRYLQKGYLAGIYTRKMREVRAMKVTFQLTAL